MTTAGPLRSRPTAELALLFLTITVCFLLIFGAVTVLAIELVHPEQSTDAIITAESEVLTVIVGAVIGYVGGRAQSQVAALEQQAADTPAEDEERG